ncbi:extracellular solute-binding protein [Paenibacillus sp. TAB 01]|uniref:extracellular solute-binding protein n=1 Tax=Paenibacillus sp. TAB 01 TaxID=3368988 RepID=UPI003751FC97
MKSNPHAPHAVFKPVRTTACLTLTAALLAACSGGGASNAPAANSGSASDSSAAKPLEIQMTVRLFDQVPDMNNAYWKEYQKRTNTKLNVEWIPDGDYTTKLNLILASGNIPEVLVANNLKSPALVSAVKNGAFWDLTPFLGDFSKYPNLKNNSAPGAWETSRILGKIYGIPQNVAQVSNGPRSARIG